MTLLRDEDLSRYVTGPAPVVTGLFRQPPNSADLYERDSRIQPCSLDLTIGKIFLPGKGRSDAGGETSPLQEYVLNPGETAVVTTHEEFRLPGHIAGIGFPPNRVSSRGILMTNPGHIDPGYVGPMHFTVINMGSQSYVLEQGAVIVTVLLLRLDAPARRDWLERHGGQVGDLPVQTYIGRLSADFIDFENRAKKIATDSISKAEWRAGAVAGVVTISVTILVALGGLAAAFLADIPLVARTAVGRLDREVQDLRGVLKGWEVRGQVTDLAKELEKVKAANCEVMPGLGYCPQKTGQPKATKARPEGKQK